MNLILNRDEYLKIRDQYRQKMIQEKQSRRIVGDKYSIHFESLSTIEYQIQEVLFLENSYDKYQEEIDIYSDMIPKENEISITLLIEIENHEKRKEFLIKASTLLGEIYIYDGISKIYGRKLDSEKLSCVNLLKFYDIDHNKQYTIISQNKYLPFMHKLDNVI